MTTSLRTSQLFELILGTYTWTACPRNFIKANRLCLCVCGSSQLSQRDLSKWIYFYKKPTWGYIGFERYIYVGTSATPSWPCQVHQIDTDRLHSWWMWQCTCSISFRMCQFLPKIVQLSEDCGAVASLFLAIPSFLSTFMQSSWLVVCLFKTGMVNLQHLCSASTNTSIYPSIIK